MKYPVGTKFRDKGGRICEVETVGTLTGDIKLKGCLTIWCDQWEIARWLKSGDLTLVEKPETPSQ